MSDADAHSPDTNDSDMGDHWLEVEDAAELIAAQEFKEAQTALETIVARTPANEYAHHLLAGIHFEAGHHERALSHYVRALELAPRYLGAMVGAGQCLRALGQFPRAKRMAKEALLVQPKDPDALYLLGVTHFQLGERDASLRYLNQFLDTHPEVEIAYEVHGMIKTLTNPD